MKNIFLSPYERTYTVRTIRTEVNMVEFEEELKNIKWHIIGLCETRLPGERMATLKSGHILYQNNSDRIHHLGGVAFLINKNIKNTMTSCQAIHYRVISMTLKLNKSYTLQIIHANKLLTGRRS